MSSTKNFFYIAARIEICYTFSKLNTRINNNCAMFILLIPSPSGVKFWMQTAKVWRLILQVINWL